MLDFQDYTQDSPLLTYDVFENTPNEEMIPLTESPEELTAYAISSMHFSFSYDTYLNIVALGTVIPGCIGAFVGYNYPNDELGNIYGNIFAYGNLGAILGYLATNYVLLYT
jgi:hypothetical protein